MRLVRPRDSNSSRCRMARPVQCPSAQLLDLEAAHCNSELSCAADRRRAQRMSRSSVAPRRRRRPEPARRQDLSCFLPTPSARSPRLRDELHTDLHFNVVDHADIAGEQAAPRSSTRGCPCWTSAIQVPLDQGDLAETLQREGVTTATTTRSGPKLPTTPLSPAASYER